MRRMLALGVLVLAGSIGNARAATIGFDDLALDTSGLGGDRVSGGFVFDTALNHSHIDNGTWGTSNGSHFMLVDNVASNPDAIDNSTTISPTGGGPFTLISLDISEAAGITTTSRMVQVTGHLTGGGTTAPLTLTLDFDPGNPGFGFQTFVFGAGWENLSRVVLTGTGAECCGPTQQARGNYYAIDNLVVEMTQVPEPGTLTLVGLGTAFLISRLRRTSR